MAEKEAGPRIKKTRRPGKLQAPRSFKVLMIAVAVAILAVLAAAVGMELFFQSRVQVRAVDQVAQEPVGGLRVTFTRYCPDNAPGCVPETLFQGTTNRRGRFTMPVQAITDSFVVEAEGYFAVGPYIKEPNQLRYSLHHPDGRTVRYDPTFGELVLPLVPKNGG